MLFYIVIGRLEFHMINLSIKGIVYGFFECHDRWAMELAGIKRLLDTDYWASLIDLSSGVRVRLAC